MSAEVEPNEDCPHGNCCTQLGYVIAQIEHLLAVYETDSPEWDVAAQIMDAVGK